jgi:hypothetical protein
MTDTVFYLSSDPTNGISLPIEGTLTSDSYLIEGNGITKANLVKVDIGNKVKSIGGRAFDACSALQSVTIGDSVETIGGGAFQECRSLQLLTIGDSVTSIGNSAFYNCRALTTVTIPDSVTSIGSAAFFDCILLQSVTIGDSVETIGDSAFGYCTALKSVTIPDSVTSIASRAFDECSALQSVTIGDSVKTIGDRAFESCKALQSLTIPNSVQTIGGNAFLSCIALQSVTIGNSVETIGDEAFRACRALQSVTIGDSVKTIGDDAFRECRALQSVTIPNSVTSIGIAAFYQCILLQSVTIGNSVETIGRSAFESCILPSLTIPDSVTIIGTDAFKNSRLFLLRIKSSNTLLKEGNETVGGKKLYVLKDDNGSKTVFIKTDGTSTVLSGNDTLDFPTGFTKSNTKHVGIGNKVTSIGEKAFSGCSKLESVTIPDSVTSIGENAFDTCSNLLSLTIPDSVTSIGDRAFYKCNRWRSVTLPTNVNFTSIGKNAFGYCEQLQSLTIPNSVETIGDEAFFDCRSLQSVTIGNSVETIGRSAFNDCYILESVTIGDSVTSIGAQAFLRCNALQSVTIGNSVETIGGNAFELCRSLQSVTIGNSVTSIGAQAFLRCDALQSVTIPNSVTKIGENAFQYSGISSVTMGLATASLFNLTPNVKQAFFGQENVFIKASVYAAFYQPGIISGDYSILNNGYNFDTGSEEVVIRLYVPGKRTHEIDRSRILIADFTNIEKNGGTEIKDIVWETTTNNGANWTTIKNETRRTYTFTYPPETSTQFRVSCKYTPSTKSSITSLSANSNRTFPLIETQQDNIERNVIERNNIFEFEDINNLSVNFNNAEFRKTVTKVSFFNNVTTISDTDTGFFEDESFVYENMQEVEVSKEVTSITGTPFPQNTRYYIRSIKKYLKPDTYTWVNHTNKKLYFYLDDSSGTQLAKTRANDGVVMNVLTAPFNYDEDNNKHEKCENVEYLYTTTTSAYNNLTQKGNGGSWTVNLVQNNKGHINVPTNIYKANKYVGGITSASDSNNKSYYMNYIDDGTNDVRTVYGTPTGDNYSESTFTIDKSTLKFNPGVVSTIKKDGFVISITGNEYLRILNVALQYGEEEPIPIRIGIMSSTWGDNRTKKSCFPGNSQLILKDGTKKIFHDIEVGDEIQVCSKDMELSYSKVIFLIHLQNYVSTEYIKFTTTSNQTIRATSDHILPVLDKNNTLQNVRATKITKEDKLYVLNNGKGVPEEIKTIETVKEEGAYTCLVKDGEYIVVDNIVASPHSHFGDGPDESYISKYVFSYNMMTLYAKGFSMLDSIGVLIFTAPLLRSMALYLSKWRWTG